MAGIFKSIFWLIFAIYISIESYRLDLGRWGMPGPGYFPFGLGILLGIISLFSLIKALKEPSSRKTTVESLKRPLWKNIVLVQIAMIVFVFLLNWIGFALCILLFTLFYLRVIMPQRWSTTIIVGLSAMFVIYVLFNILLNAQLPKGLLKFLGI